MSENMFKPKEGGKCRARWGRAPEFPQFRSGLASNSHPRYDALVLHGHDVPLGAAAVRDPADVRQDGAAGARRIAVGVGGLRVLLPGRAAGRLHLRALAHQQGATRTHRHHPSGRVRRWPSRSCQSGCSKWWGEPPQGSPISGSSACSRGRSACRSLPLSANAPLLQAWFARSGHPMRAIPTSCTRPATWAA